MAQVSSQDNTMDYQDSIKGKKIIKYMFFKFSLKTVLFYNHMQFR